MTSAQWRGATALLTGASRGIGPYVARTLAAETYAPLEIFSVAGIIYLVIVFSTSRLVTGLEKRWTLYRC